jgi:Tfp pilus assembly protein PilF
MSSGIRWLRAQFREWIRATIGAKQELSERLSTLTDQIRADPRNHQAYAMRAIEWQKGNELEIALMDHNKAIKLCPTVPAWYNNRGITLRSLRRFREAILDFTKAIELDRMYAAAFNNRGIAYRALKRNEEAIQDFREAIRHDPNDPTAFNNRGNAYKDLLNCEKAIEDFTTAIQLDPSFGLAFANRARCLRQLAKHDQALHDFERAIELTPEDGTVCNNFAWFLATCREQKWRDGPRALELSREACELVEWKKAGYLDTLAAAYAECGSFEQAIGWQKKAIELNKLQEGKDQSLSDRRQLYEDGTAFRL